MQKNLFLFLNFPSSRHYSSADIIVLCSKNHIYSIIYTDIKRIRIISLENVIIAFFIREELTYPRKPTCELWSVIPFLVALIFLTTFEPNLPLSKDRSFLVRLLLVPRLYYLSCFFVQLTKSQLFFSGQDGRAV